MIRKRVAPTTHARHSRVARVTAGLRRRVACATIRPVHRRLLLATTVATLAACGGGGGAASAPSQPTPTMATVNFVYTAPTARRGGLPSDCADFVGPTHLHPSWRQFVVTPMNVVGDHFEISLSDVPVGSVQQVRVNDVNACADNSTGYVLKNFTANGVALVTVVPGNSGATGFASDPGLSFTVDGQGRVTP